MVPGESQSQERAEQSEELEGGGVPKKRRFLGRVALSLRHGFQAGYDRFVSRGAESSRKKEDERLNKAEQSSSEAARKKIDVKKAVSQGQAERSERSRERDVDILRRRTEAENRQRDRVFDGERRQIEENYAESIYQQEEIIKAEARQEKEDNEQAARDEALQREMAERKTQLEANLTEAQTGLEGLDEDSSRAADLQRRIEKITEKPPAASKGLRKIRDADLARFTHERDRLQGALNTEKAAINDEILKIKAEIEAIERETKSIETDRAERQKRADERPGKVTTATAEKTRLEAKRDSEIETAKTKHETEKAEYSQKKEALIADPNKIGKDLLGNEKVGLWARLRAGQVVGLIKDRLAGRRDERRVNRAEVNERTSGYDVKYRERQNEHAIRRLVEVRRKVEQHQTDWDRQRFLDSQNDQRLEDYQKKTEREKQINADADKAIREIDGQLSQIAEEARDDRREAVDEKQEQEQNTRDIDANIRKIEQAQDEIDELDSSIEGAEVSPESLEEIREKIKNARSRNYKRMKRRELREAERSAERINAYKAEKQALAAIIEQANAEIRSLRKRNGELADRKDERTRREGIRGQRRVDLLAEKGQADIVRQSELVAAQADYDASEKARADALAEFIESYDPSAVKESDEEGRGKGGKKWRKPALAAGLALVTAVGMGLGTSLDNPDGVSAEKGGARVEVVDEAGSFDSDRIGAILGGMREDSGTRGTVGDYDSAVDTDDSVPSAGSETDQSAGGAGETGADGTTGIEQESPAPELEDEATQEITIQNGEGWLSVMDQLGIEDTSWTVDQSSEIGQELSGLNEAYWEPDANNGNGEWRVSAAGSTQLSDDAIRILRGQS
jgi:hypothetical protein